MHPFKCTYIHIDPGFQKGNIRAHHADSAMYSLEGG
jgi:hypothetical protein